MILKIKKLIIKILSFLPDKILLTLEKTFSISRGKGLNFSIKNEFSNFLKFNENINVFVDIGGNKGEYTEQIIKNFPNSEGFIFEPDSKNYLFLKKKFKSKKIIVIKKALSNTTGKNYIFSNKRSSGRSSLYKRRLDHYGFKFKKIEKVKITTMSSYYQKNIKKVVDFCKIDIEGNELNCLYGFKKFIERFRYIQFEFNGCNIDSKTFFQDFWYFFKKNNFRLYRLTPTGPLLIKNYTEEDEHFGMNNFIAQNNRFIKS